MGSSTSLIISIKALLISTGVVSIAILFKLSFPILIQFLLFEIPIFWSSILSLLRPPYIYFVINAIIITILASSRFSSKKIEDSDQPQPSIQSKSPSPPSDLPSIVFAPLDVYQKIEAPVAVYEIIEAPIKVYETIESPIEVIKSPISDLMPPVVNNSEAVTWPDENEFVISRSTWTPPKKINSAQKPLVSSRFSHRKPTKASPEGGNRALRVAKPRRQETLVSTWKTITDGRHVPLTRHLKKSDTFENHGRDGTADLSPRHVTKSETFWDRTNYDSPSPAGVGSSPVSGGRLRKEASLSQDELNRRVEAFIKKFNEEMRLQRQESLNQYVEMVNRGSH